MAVQPDPVSRIPVIVVTGFLGSGKTTLLSRALHQPAMAGTLVLVNELGEIGLDHHLLWSGGGMPILLENGCICCTVGDDFVTLLEELFWQRLHRKIARFNRVVVETTGLADPRALAAALRAHPLLAERYCYGGTITVVDAAAGLTLLDAHPEAVAQVALADRLVLSKTDRAANEHRVPLLARLQAINPFAPAIFSEHGSAGVGAFDAIEAQSSVLMAPLMRGHAATSDGGHLRDVTTISVPLRDDLSWPMLRESLGNLAAVAGPKLLRAKGVVLLEDRPMLVQMVGQTLEPPTPFSTRGGAMDGALVVILRGISAAVVRSELAPISAPYRARQ